MDEIVTVIIEEALHEELHNREIFMMFVKIGLFAMLQTEEFRTRLFFNVIQS
jgi:hypothetical protein